MDKAGAIYVADTDNHRVQKWEPGATTGITVAGGNGVGSATNQLSGPSGVAVDMAGAVYVADYANHRIQKWLPGATSGTTIAGGHGAGSATNQLNHPIGIAVDAFGAIYIADTDNHRIQKWAVGATTGITIAGGNGVGSAANQLDQPRGVDVDGNGAVYVADADNHRIQKFNLVQTDLGNPLGGSNQALQLLAPLYDCQSGAFTFRASGGNGTPIEYMAAGITGWTTNPNHFVHSKPRKFAYARPLVLKVRQRGRNGIYVKDDYEWDIRTVCSVSAPLVAGARRGSVRDEATPKWRATVYPNPVGAEFTVKIEGAQQESVRLLLLDVRGRVLVDKQVVVEQAAQLEKLVLGDAGVGLYLLRVSSARQSETLKVLKEH